MVDIKQFMNQEIHQKGRLFMPDDLMQNVTGQSITVNCFINYLTDKYHSLYSINT